MGRFVASTATMGGPPMLRDGIDMPSTLGEGRTISIT